jgi:plastocyanin
VTVGVANARTSHSDAKTSIAVATITIHSFSYSVPAGVRHGAQVKVVNNDGVAHTVTSNAAGKFNVRVPAHSSRFFTAPKIAKNYGFHCTLHPSMKAVLHVT